jgi:hypothetical protein
VAATVILFSLFKSAAAGLRSAPAQAVNGKQTVAS